MILVDAGRPAGLDRPRFFARRILRLWPTLYLYLAMLVATGGADGWRLVWPVMLHVQNYATDVPSHLWSLAVEEHFYLIAAIVLPALLHRTDHRGVGMALVAILAGCLALRLGALWFGEIPRHLQWQSQYRADSIAAGVLIAWAELYRPALIDRAARHRAACLVVALAGFAVLAGVADERFRYSIGLTIAWAASVAFVLAIYRVRVPAPLSPVAGVLAWTGGIAYPLYIFHVSFGRVADAIALAMDIRSPIAAIVLALRHRRGRQRGDRDPRRTTVDAAARPAIATGQPTRAPDDIENHSQQDVIYSTVAGCPLARSRLCGMPNRP